MEVEFTTGSDTGERKLNLISAKFVYLYFIFSALVLLACLIRNLGSYFSCYKQPCFCKVSGTEMTSYENTKKKCAEEKFHLR